jgi:hypothetical protein
MQYVTKEMGFSEYRVYSVSTDNILYGYVKCSILYTEKSLRLNICSCYSWEIALNIGLNAFLMTCRTGKECGRKGRELTVRKLMYQLS